MKRSPDWRETSEKRKAARRELDSLSQRLREIKASIVATYPGATRPDQLPPALWMELTSAWEAARSALGHLPREFSDCNDPQLFRPPVVWLSRGRVSPNHPRSNPALDTTFSQVMEAQDLITLLATRRVASIYLLIHGQAGGASLKVRVRNHCDLVRDLRDSLTSDHPIDKLHVSHRDGVLYLSQADLPFPG